jgi:hypothetical protein
MNIPTFAVERLAGIIASTSAAIGQSVDIDLQVLDRSDAMTLRPPDRISANGSARMIRAADGWLAVNLPRESDIELVPAWLGDAIEGDMWAAIETGAALRRCADLLARARLLGLAVAGVGEVGNATLLPPVHRLGHTAKRSIGLTGLDLSGLWAGPLCGAILAQAGVTMTKIESPHRPDTTRAALPALDARLNGLKARQSVDFTSAAGRAHLRHLFETADIVITSARPRAFDDLGLAPTSVFAANTRLIWIAISGYGWMGDASDRIAFGDDAAAAAGLVHWSGDEPHFAGDAIADPLTGLAAAAAALRAIDMGGGVLIDAALAGTAAGAVATARQGPPIGTSGR